MTSLRETKQHFYHGLNHTNLFGLRAIGCGRCQGDYREQHPITWRDYSAYCVIHITRGEAFYESEFQSRVECGVGAGFLLIPGVKHSYGILEGKDFEETWIAFEGPAIEASLALGQFSRERSFFPEPGEGELTTLFEASYAKANQGTVAAQRQLPALFLAILTQLIPLGSAEVAGPLWLGEAERLLTERAGESVNVQAMAKHFRVSYSSFRAIFKQATGLAPGTYHLARKMNLACDYLTQGATVAEAGRAVGIKDPFYFSRLFKKHVGLPPSRYQSAQG